MQVTITAVGPDNRGLADPIVHYVTGAGANIHEIQMYDHDSERLFAMLLRTEWPIEKEPIHVLRERMNEIGRLKDLSIRTWSRDEHQQPPRLAICTTYRPESALAVLRAIRDKRLRATPAVMIGNRPTLPRRRRAVRRRLADGRPTRNGNPDNDRNDRTLRPISGRLHFAGPLYAQCCLQTSAGDLPAGSSTSTMACCRRFPASDPTRTPIGTDADLRRDGAISSCPNSMPAIRSSIRSTFTVFPGTPLDESNVQGETDHEPLVPGGRRSPRGRSRSRAALSPRRPPRRARLTGQQPFRPGEHVVQHCFGEPAGESVLLARVKAAQQPPVRCERLPDAVAELRNRSRVPSPTPRQVHHRAPADLPQR